MFRITLALTVIAAAVAACATAPTPVPRALMTAPAPITFDGNVAGQATDYVFVLVPEANPATAGMSLRAGEVLRLALPAVFKRNASVALSDTDTNLMLTKGWPQGSVRLPGQYRVGFDEKANTVTVTALQAVTADGANAPVTMRSR